MPLTEDPKTLATSQGLVSSLHAAAGGAHGEFRPAHAKGTLLTGTFTPSPPASTLTTAPHFNNPNTALTVRFSSSTGLPQIPDTDPQANPRGIAIRFNLGPHKHTDIIAHSTPFFPTRTGEEFLDFLNRAIKGEGVEEFLATHPETKRFLEAEKPSPVSFATELFFGVNAFKYISKEGKVHFLRYRVVPVAGLQTLSVEELKSKSETYLFDELKARLTAGPIEFKLMAQVANEGDVTDDNTVHWPEDREVVELGALKLDTLVPQEEDRKEQKMIIFDPIPRVDGIEASEDPLLQTRAAVYLISGRERRAA